jgi:hypothetical protein
MALLSKWPNHRSTRFIPTGTPGDEVRHEPRITLQPRLHFRVLVRPVVVHDQMQPDIAGELVVDSAQEFE